jgi:hypothetical protein
MSESEKPTENWRIIIVQKIIDGGIGTLVACGLLYILWTQTQILRENMEAQTRALERISIIYSGGEGAK